MDPEEKDGFLEKSIFKKVKVDWVCVRADFSGWKNLKDILDETENNVTSLGYFIHSNQSNLWIATNINDANNTFYGVTRIPTQCIIKMEFI